MRKMHAFHFEKRTFHFEMHKTADFHSKLSVCWALVTEGYQGNVCISYISSWSKDPYQVERFSGFAMSPGILIKLLTQSAIIADFDSKNDNKHFGILQNQPQELNLKAFMYTVGMWTFDEMFSTKILLCEQIWTQFLWATFTIMNDNDSDNAS